MSQKIITGTLQEIYQIIEDQEVVVGQLFYDIETSNQYIYTENGSLDLIISRQKTSAPAGLEFDSTIVAETTFVRPSPRIRVVRPPAPPVPTVPEELEIFRSEEVIADPEDEADIVIDNKLTLNSKIKEQISEVIWGEKYSLFKKRIYLYREYEEDEDLTAETAIPYIEPFFDDGTEIIRNSVNFINNTVEIDSRTIISDDGKTWTLDPEEIESSNLVVSSFILYDRNPVHIFETIKYGDIPSKFVPNQNKADIILFKNVEEGYQFGEEDKVLGPTLYDYFTGTLRELEPSALNGWSATFKEPNLEAGEETYAIAVSLTSNEIPSYIYPIQWTWPPKPIRTVARDGEDGKNAIRVELTADKSTAINYNQFGLLPQPSGTITLTATAQNIDDPEFSFDGGNTFTTTNTFEFNIPAQYFEEPVLIAVIAREQNTTTPSTFDQITITAIKPGEEGEDAVNALLTNETHTIPANSDGTYNNTTAFADAGGSFKLYLGTSLITSGVTYSGTITKNGLTITINASTGVYSLSSVANDAWSTNSESFTLKATFQGTEYEKVYTITKAIRGVAGFSGLRAISGVLYFQTAEETAPSISFQNISYTISTATFSPNPPSGWGVIPPVFVANESNKYWYVNWSGQESSPNSNTISTFTNTAPVQAINFDGLVTFTDVSGDKVITTDDITSIQGGLLKTAVIQSNATYTENSQQVPRLEINFNEGTIAAQNFNIDSFGNASFAGTVNATAGNIGNWNIATIGSRQWLRSLNLSDGEYTYSTSLTNEFFGIEGVSNIGQRSFYSSIERDKFRAGSYLADSETYVDLSYNALTIDKGILGAENFTIENKIGSLALKATGLTHSDTARFLTISSTGVLGTSTGTGEGGTGTNPGGANGNVQFNDNGSFGGTDDLHWDNVNNRLGIGTTSPGYSVETVGGSGTTLQIRNNTTGNGTNSILRFGNSNLASTGFGTVELAAIRTNFPSNGTTGLTITTALGSTVTGRVLIDYRGITLLDLTSTLRKAAGAGNLTIVTEDPEGDIVLAPLSDKTVVLGDFEVTGSVQPSNFGTSRSSNYTFTINDRNRFIRTTNNAPNNIQLTIDTDILSAGDEIHIWRSGGGDVEIVAGSGMTIISEGSKRKINLVHQVVTIKAVSSNTVLLFGALKT
jgi:hypothetical protein